MRLRLTHRIALGFRPEAEGVALRLRLWPVAHAGQAVADWQVLVNGAPLAPVGADAFGHRVGLWQASGPVAAIEVLAEGGVETRDLAGVVRDLPVRVPEALFLRTTALTEPGERVAALAAGIAAGEPLGRLHALSAAVAGAVVLAPRDPEAGAGAEAALARGTGTAEDQAHAFVAAARLLDLPARVATGARMRDGEAEPGLHHWAEAAVPGLGWVGFDPGAALCPTDAWVRYGAGFDAADAAPLRLHLPAAAARTEAASVRVARDRAGFGEDQ